MVKAFFLFSSLFIANTLSAQIPACQPNLSLLQTSEQLLWRVKHSEPTDSLTDILTKTAQISLEKGLCNDNAKKTFWINIYNAYYQILIKKGISRDKIFTQQVIPIAENLYSLDEIEHGILRRSAAKYGMGYAPKAFPAQYIQHLQVDVLDYRIHFALNCGAKSCPPIAFYQYNSINEQLERATNSYLNIETTVNEKAKVVEVTQIMQWFEGDFGGRNGVKKILEKYLGKKLKGYKIRYQPFNNDTYLDNFQ